MTDTEILLPPNKYIYRVSVKEISLRNGAYFATLDSSPPLSIYIDEVKPSFAAGDIIRITLSKELS